MAEYSIGPLTQIPPGEGRNFIIAAQKIAVFHTREGGVFATQAHCPHKNGPLADGLVDAHSVVCPLHDRVFAFATGAGSDCDIATYRATVADGIITITL